MKTDKLKIYWLAMTGMLIYCSVVSAQSNWMIRRDARVVSLEWLKPSYSGYQDASFGTSVYYLSTRLPLSNKYTFIAEIPYSHYGNKGNGYFPSVSEGSIGNPYIGMEIGDKDSSVFTEAGVRLPMVSDNKYNAQANGILTDWNRLDAFMNDVIPITFKVNNYVKYGSGFVSRIRVGPEFWIVTDKDAEDNFELFLLYSAHAGFESDNFGMGIGFSGRYWITLGDQSSFSDQTVHQVDFNIFGKFKNIRPGIYLRAPLDDNLEEVLNSVFGLNVDFVLN